MQNTGNGIMPLELFARRSKMDRAVLRGADGRALFGVTVTHTVHRQAVYGLVSSIQCHALQWKKGHKLADVTLTPPWAYDVVQQAIQSILAVGYVVYRAIPKRGIITVAPPGMFDLEFYNSAWRIHDTKHRAAWSVLIWSAPRFNVDGNNYVHTSAAQGARKATAIYNELYDNFRRRDVYNSQPSVYTSVDPSLQSDGKYNKTWFRSHVTPGSRWANDNTGHEGHAIAPKPYDGVLPTDPTQQAEKDNDKGFGELLTNRADAIRRLGDASQTLRQSSTTAVPQLGRPNLDAGVIVGTEPRQHAEHIVTDGRRATPARALMSLTDGFQLLRQASYDIFWHYGVPPQITGQNINAERSGINSRLNEIVVTQFGQTVARMRVILETMFAELPVAGSVLMFEPVVSPADLMCLQGLLKPEKVIELYASTYHIPKTHFKPATDPAFATLSGVMPDDPLKERTKRKRQDISNEKRDERR